MAAPDNAPPAAFVPLFRNPFFVFLQLLALITLALTLLSPPARPYSNGIACSASALLFTFALRSLRTQLKVLCRCWWVFPPDSSAVRGAQ
ncbi:hypothetical protein B0H11DRAFT_1990596 [Mycena galericulata]|nr:hypothetical protein B0H11DRAFT_1990596 [Mycena galericulata]